MVGVCVDGWDYEIFVELCWVVDVEGVVCGGGGVEFEVIVRRRRGGG